ncbi:MAG: right-handed parallel beta-helix repeat-containing protein [Sedimentisphaerales bacterium]|nr:right-handed parallel beta-helix repeat-containing protein [Sedimentisphaerales bacterium]
MKMKVLFVLTTLCISTVPVSASPPVEVEILEVKKIWDNAPHNAFTDLARWNGKFYCAFREGRGHVSTDGKIRVLESADANAWISAAIVSLEGYDLRDAHLSVTSDDRLMLVGGAAPRQKDNQNAPTGTFVSFSKDGREWSKPEIAVQPGRWMWQVSWRDGRAYGVSYAAGDRKPWAELLVSSDGVKYQSHVAELFGEGYPTEVTLRFDEDGTCYALMRRDRSGDSPSSAMLGVSRPDYKQWRWRDLGTEFNGFGGPNFIKVPGGHWIAAGRMHQGGAHTALTYIDLANGTMATLAKLPSGGDTSYPGLVWHDDMLYVSYYSSHEGKTSIYLAKVKVTSKETFGAETNPTGDPIGGGKGYRQLVNRGDYNVKTLAELRTALEKAVAGQLVYIDDTAEIDMSDSEKLVIPAGVTVASGRGKADSAGALLYSGNLGTSPLFAVGGDGVRVTGLRLRGPDQERRTEEMHKLHAEGRYYSIPNSDGIICQHPALEVDNCEVWGWSHAGVFLKPGATKAHIHHNYMHHNQRSGLGYGVCLDQSDALIEANLFDWCRHHIAGTGRPKTSYEARYNLVLENANGHSFDMHGGADRKDGTDIAGDLISIHHNTLKATSVRAIVIRGKPRESVEIHHNWFLHSDSGKAIAQTNASGNMNVGPNQYTTERTVKD